MPDIGKAVQDLTKAAQDYGAARQEEEAAQKDEDPELAAMKAASKAVMRAKGKEATAAAGREFHRVEALWRAANTRRKKATLARMLAEKKFREKMRKFNEAMWALMSP
ncbi:hypothetical protein [Mesorhizobium sp. B2-3-4]|uniref:hypothetical protein n=1 Tax=Mesorhizobium sp. B2-3-4 TaxID=2589959 RepID=UPI00112743E2|nr:hypothetical protein [Mesorhizobium sp. B2-3-4]TPM34204.1 hypothetical protein FJ967_22455 [Mesorhizobium sp. B2-3-4]